MTRESCGFDDICGIWQWEDKDGDFGIVKRAIMKKGKNVECFSSVGCGNRFMRCNQNLSLHSTDDISEVMSSLGRIILP